MAQTITTTASACVNTGGITIGGTVGAGGPYQLTITGYPPAYTPVGTQTATSLPYVFTALFPGLYTIAIADRLGAVSVFSGIQVQGNYVLPGNSDYAPVATGIRSCRFPDGKIQGVMTNGRPPYTYTILSGPLQAGSTNTTGIFTGLAAGTYRLQAADSCQNIQTREVTVTDSVTTFGVTQTFIKRTGCTSFSLDSVYVSPAFPSQGRYEIINYNSNGTPVVKATGFSLPLSFSVFSVADIPNGKVAIVVYDTCGNRNSYIPVTYKNYSRDTITNGIINKIGCNRYSLDVLNMVPPLAPGATVQLTNTATGQVYSSPLPVQFTAAPSDITTGRITIRVTDSCGTSTSTALVRTISNQWNFSPVFKIYCSTVVIDSLVFSGFVVQPYTIKVKALFTDSTGNIDSTSEQVVTSFPYTVAGIAGSPNPLTIRIEVRDSCGEVKRVTLTQSFILASGVIRNLNCGAVSIDLSVLGRYVSPVTYSVSPDLGIGTNTTGHFELPGGVYTFTARDSCGKQTSLGPLDFTRTWKAKAQQDKGCSGQFIVNDISIPSRSFGTVTVHQYQGAQPVTAASLLLRTKSFTSQFNNCASCSATSITGERIVFDSTLPRETYTYVLTDDCGKSDTVTIVNDTVALRFYHRAFPVVKCVSGSNIYASWKHNGDSSVIVKVFNSANNELVNFNSGTADNTNTYPNGQLVLSDAPRGVYYVKYRIKGCTREYIDTISTVDYVQPVVTAAASIAPCSGGSPVIVAGAQGIAPYQYEIINSFPDHLTSPAQTSPVFNLPASQSSVTIRIVDACLNSSTRTVPVAQALPPFIRTNPALLSACTLPFAFSLLSDSVYAGSVFEWTKITGIGAGPSVIGRQPSLPLIYGSVADTGTYRLRVTVPNTCFDESSTFTVAIVPVTCLPGIAGNVFNDANGLTDNTVNGRGTNAGGVFAVLVNSTDTIMAVSPVTVQGVYGFLGVPSGTYSILLTNTSATVGSVAPLLTLPMGWINTGEHMGLSTGDDGVVNGRLSNIIVDTSIISEYNFGIEQLPVARDTTAPRTNPGGNIRISVPVLTGSDAEDGIYDGVSGINTVMIQTLPSNAALYYNGMAVTAGQAISNYNPALLTIDPNANIASASFTFSEVDAANQASAPATVTIIFYGLPVYISSLTATPVNGTVLINWQVEEQINLLQYVIESSVDGRDFIQIDSVEANSRRSYQYTHLTPVPGINFYRLRIIETDGSFSYSKVMTVQMAREDVIKIVPNPFSNNIKLLIHLVKSQPVRIIISDAAGKKIYETLFNGNMGLNRFELNSLHHLLRGVYFVSVQAGDLISNQKLIRQ